MMSIAPCCASGADDVMRAQLTISVRGMFAFVAVCVLRLL